MCELARLAGKKNPGYNPVRPGRGGVGVFGSERRVVMAGGIELKGSRVFSGHRSYLQARDSAH
jgi:hypothetical protein